MNRKLTSILAAGLSFILLAGCSASKDAVSQEKVLPVVVQTVQEGTIEHTLSFTGTVEANSLVQLSSKAGGRVVSIPVKVGQNVNEGDVLLQVDDTDLRNALRQAEAQLNSAKANLNQARSAQQAGAVTAGNAVAQAKQAYEDAKTQYTRMESLFQAGAVSKQQFDQAKTALLNAELSLKNAEANHNNANRTDGIKVAEQAVNQAQVGYDIAASNLNNATIRAPKSGTVAAISTEVGQMIAPSTPVITFVDMKKMKVKLEIPEASLPYFQPGNTLNITFDTHQIQTTGTVESVSPLNNTASKGYPVVVTIDNADALIKPGMVAKVTATKTSETKKGLKIPTDSILTVDGKTVVYVVDGDRAVKREITVQEQTSTDSLVSGDLKPGDQVIIKGQTLIKEDTKVKIVEK